MVDLLGKGRAAEEEPIADRSSCLGGCWLASAAMVGRAVDGQRVADGRRLVGRGSNLARRLRGEETMG